MSAPLPAALSRLRLLAPDPGDVPSALLRLSFAAPAAPGALAVPLTLIEGAASERWSGEGDPPNEAHSVSVLARSGGLAVAAWQAHESAESPLEAQIGAIYRQINDVLARSGGLHPVKVWHYIADINAGEGSEERYQRFCVARAPHLDGRDPLPAATAIGAPAASPLTIILLASRAAPEPVENPRQVPAYHYPERYSPRAPHFSRAMRLPCQLFVSGTAAVVGHESLHPGDALAQLVEIRANLDALLEAAGGRWLPRLFQVYVRYVADWPRLRQAWRATFAVDCPVRVLQGDISRRDLLVEVEALYDAL